MPLPSVKQAVALAARTYSDMPTYAWRDIHALRQDDGDLTYIAFRGTTLNLRNWEDSVEDWLCDLRAWPKFHRHLGWCHAGFLNAALEIEPHIRAAVRGCRIVMTGHSLGGALAILVSALMAVDGVPVESLITFGAPKAAFRRLRKRFKGVDVRQFKFGHDVVPDVPCFLPPLFDYFHIAAELGGCGVSTGDGIEDHHVANYVAILG